MTGTMALWGILGWVLGAWITAKWHFHRYGSWGDPFLDGIFYYQHRTCVKCKIVRGRIIS